MFRYVYDPEKSFTEEQKPTQVNLNFARAAVTNADELLRELKSRVEATCSDPEGGGYCTCTEWRN